MRRRIVSKEEFKNLIAEKQEDENHCYKCENVINSQFCWECKNLKNCLYCFQCENLVDSQFYWRNEKISEEEWINKYLEYIASLIKISQISNTSIAYTTTIGHG